MLNVVSSFKRIFYSKTRTASIKISYLLFIITFVTIINTSIKVSDVFGDTTNYIQHSNNLDVESERDSSSDKDDSLELTAQTGTMDLDEPLLGTFYYVWYGHWDHWKNHKHDPPRTWTSNFLPDLLPNQFAPEKELYDSSNLTVVSQHLKWMAQAGIQFGIVSWWGVLSDSDKALSKIFSSNITQTIYPGFKWVILYEEEGFGDPSVEKILSEIHYIESKYTTHPDYLKIDGKPVIFVYNAGNKGKATLNDYERWEKIRELTGFFVVLKVDPIANGADPLGMDSWYQYAPSKRYDKQKDWSAMVSPGFWKSHEDPRLERNLTDFELAVQKLADADVQFKLIETFNEWSEGTGIEPATLVDHDDTNDFSPRDEGYGTAYLDIIAKYFKN